MTCSMGPGVDGEDRGQTEESEQSQYAGPENFFPQDGNTKPKGIEGKDRNQDKEKIEQGLTLSNP